jgi:hypothetical protein
MKHFSMEGFTSLSQEELSALEGGGFLTNLTAKLTSELTEAVEMAKDLTTATGGFLKTVVDIIV